MHAVDEGQAEVFTRHIWSTGYVLSQMEVLYKWGKKVGGIFLKHTSVELLESQRME